MATAITADGVHIDWTEQGAGPPVVLVHGITESKEVWAPIAARLAADHRVVSLDLRGHGASAPGPRYEPGDLALDVAAVVTAAGLERPDLVGHSLGGVVVTAAASAVGARSVVNVDQSLALGDFQGALAAVEAQLRDPATFPFVIEAVFESMAGPLLSDDDRQRIAALRRPTQDVVLGIWSPLLDRSPAEVVAMVDAMVAGVDVPYLSLFGSDPGPDYAGWLSARIAGAVVEVWPEHGHYPHLVDQGRFLARLESFWHPLA